MKYIKTKMKVFLTTSKHNESTFQTKNNLKLRNRNIKQQINPAYNVWTIL